ncbi:DUF2207 domain-containing protein [Nocardioides sp.]|uniref:DUF2207 family protein n=1 Tax=Nocardioides sp. TaxID=35761 RepID=UPI0035287F74
MLGWLLRLAGLVLLAIGVLARVAPTPDRAQTPEYDETTISDYRADFTVDDQGNLSVVERLSVDFPFSGKHGIFRFFDTRDENDLHARRVPEDISVTRDGSIEPVDLSRRSSGRYVVARIGSPDRTVLPGTHVYEIRYRIDGVLLPGPSEGVSTFNWNLIPGGWQQPITSARLQVRLPVPGDDVRCAVGWGATDGCRARGAGTDTLVVRTGPLPPMTPVTLATDLTLATPPAGHTLPWTQRLDPLLGRSVPLAVVVLLAALGALVAGAVASLRAREPQPPFPLQYAPPDGVGPAQGVYVLTERVGKRSFVASLLQAAEHGAVSLERSGKSWTIADARGNEGWRGLDSSTMTVAGLIPGPGAAFVASKKDVTSGEALQKQLEKLKGTTTSWGARQGLVVPSGPGALGGLLVLVAAVLAAVLCSWDPFSMTAMALVPGLFAIGAASLVLPGAGTIRTRAGREMWSRLGGFRRVLSTPSSVERFGFSGREELYTAYLPWAVAFDCADEWAEKFRIETGSEPPAPAYLGGYAGGWGGSSVDSMVGDFSSTLSSAISSYESSQSSSGGGGGGFSGGGGGGGGGGGSW